MSLDFPVINTKLLLIVESCPDIPEELEKFVSKLSRDGDFSFHSALAVRRLFLECYICTPVMKVPMPLKRVNFSGHLSRLCALEAPIDTALQISRKLIIIHS